MQYLQIELQLMRLHCHFRDGFWSNAVGHHIYATQHIIAGHLQILVWRSHLLDAVVS